MSARRVVVTGMGALNPLGTCVHDSWDNLIAGRSGVREISYFDTEQYDCKIAGSIPKIDFSELIGAKDLLRMDPFICYGLVAAREAIIQSGVTEDKFDPSRIGVIVGSGIGGLGTIENTSIKLSQSSRGRVSPYFIPSSLINLASGHIAIKYGFTGPNSSIATACASGTHAIGEGYRNIQYGSADVVVVGASEAPITPVGVAGFISVKALTTKFNDSPKAASRPWDVDRSGFVIGEGAGIIILEEYERAKKRGAKVYAEIVGYGLSADAFHITAPNGEGAKLSMLNSIKDAGISFVDIDYINAHGTSTPVGDVVELNAVQELFKDNDKIAMSSTKSSTGHLLGAAGAVEAIFTILALNNNLLPPTLNLDKTESTNINLVPHVVQEKDMSYVLSNSFGFGGTNASIVFRKI